MIATVEDTEIRLSEFQKRYQSFLLSTGVKDNLSARYSVLNNMINEIVLKDYDDNDNLFRDPEYEKELKWDEKEAVLNYLKDREIYAKIRVTDKELRQAYFRAHVAIAARHLFAKTKEEADNLYALLKAGASFKELAKQVFSDPTLRENGGYLGYFRWGDMDPAFENAAYSLKVGEISKPVKTAYGYSIIKVEDKKEIPFMTEDDFQKRKKNLERSLKIAKKYPYEKAYIAKLFDEKELKFNDDILPLVLRMLHEPLATEVESDKVQSKICATYKYHKYSVAEIYSMLSEIPRFHLSKITDVRKLKTAIKGIIIQNLLYRIALDKGYDKLPAVRNAAEGLKMITFLKYKMDDIVSVKTFPDSAVRSYYKKNLSEFTEPRKLNVKEIILSRKSLADSVLGMLKKGASFATLAKKYSERRWSAENGGEIGLSPIYEFGSLKDTLWKSPLGKIVGPIKIQDYYGIFKVIEKQEAHPIPFETIRPQVLARMKADLKTKIVNDYLSLKKQKLKIEINYKKIRFAKFQ